MPVPTDKQIKELGPEISPFARNPAGLRSILDGEVVLFKEQLYNATEDGKPSNVIQGKQNEIETDSSYGRYLWIIDQKGLWLILEATPNPESKRGCVCHTNITGGGKAFQGGELWFGKDDTVYLNFNSGRYGHPTTNQTIAVFQYFQYVGYKDIQILN